MQHHIASKVAFSNSIRDGQSMSAGPAFSNMVIVEDASVRDIERVIEVWGLSAEECTFPC